MPHKGRYITTLCVDMLTNQQLKVNCTLNKIEYQFYFIYYQILLDIMELLIYYYIK